MTDHLGQSQVLPYLIELSNKGYKFFVLSCEKEKRFEKEKEKIKALCNKNNIVWEPITYTKKPPIFSTIKDVYSLRKKALRIIQKEDIHAIHCRSYIAGLIGLELKKKKKIPFIFDMRGFYAEEKSEVGTWPLENPFFRLVYNYFKSKEKEFFRYADGVISLTEAGKKEINSWNIRPKNRQEIKVIPCSIDFNHFYPLSNDEKSKSKEVLGIAENSKVLSFLGSLGSWYMLEEMLQFYIQFRSKVDNAKLLFITSEKPAYIREKAGLFEILDSEIIILQANREEVPFYLSASDYGLFFIKPFFSKKGSSPTKLGEYLAMNIPVFTNTGIGDVNEIIQKTNGGVIINDFSIEEYDRSISTMLQLSNEQILSIREKAKAYYDLDLAVGNYCDVYEQTFN